MLPDDRDREPAVMRAEGQTADAEAETLPARKLNRLAEAERRKARAADKLRENLLKRKQQVRARRAGEAETGVGLPASGADEAPD